MGLNLVKSVFFMEKLVQAIKKKVICIKLPQEDTMQE